METTPMSKPELSKATSAAFKKGARAAFPHGSNCIDVDVVPVKPGRPLKVLYSDPKEKPVELSAVFPLKRGLLGPFEFKIPATARILDREYKTWRICRAKIPTGNGCKWVKVLHVF